MPELDASSGLVETLVRHCRGRVAAHIRWQEGFLGLAVLLAGACALLLMGTRYVPVAMLPLAAALGAWLAVQRWKTGVPGPYAVAQIIDEREDLLDQISTAYYFRSAPGGPVARPVAASQYEQAVRSAAGLRPAAIFPRAIPVTRRAAIALVGVAALLLGLRVSLQPAVSFEPPLASLLMSSLFGFPPQRPPAELDRAALIDEQADAENASEEELEAPPAGTSEGSDTRLAAEEYEDPPSDSDEMPEVEGLITVPLEEPGIDALGEDPSVQGDRAEAGSAAGEDAEVPPDPEGDGWNEEAQSLLDKLKEAFDNMLQTLDMASVESADSAAGKEQGSGTSEQAQSAGDPAEAGDPEMASESGSASMEGGEPGQEAAESASVGNTGGEDSTGDSSSSENASAAGTSDGSKELAEAEQLEVLGALEELYMERAENMTGEVTIETRLAEQHASVPYNQRSTTHADGGGTISRDEIPAPYRTYIRNYFETLRRNAE